MCLVRYLSLEGRGGYAFVVGLTGIRIIAHAVREDSKEA